MLQSSGPRHFLVLGTGFVEDNFSMNWEVGGWFCEIQAHYIYCALYFYFVAAAGKAVKKGNTHTLLVKLKISEAIMENSMDIPQKNKNRTAM